MLNSEVPCVRYLIGQTVKTYNYINCVVLTLSLSVYDINCVVLTLPLSVYEGTWTHSPPLVVMHLLDRSCVIVGKF